MPPDSSWNTPSVSPAEIIRYTAGIVDGDVLGLDISGSFLAHHVQRVAGCTVRVRRPRKSIFRRPSRSSVPMGYWVVMTSSLVCRGTYSVTGLRGDEHAGRVGGGVAGHPLQYKGGVDQARTNLRVAVVPSSASSEGRPPAPWSRVMPSCKGHRPWPPASTAA